jgi:hypothetical protein
LLETSAELMLRYTNETIEPLALAGSAHRLYLNGSYVGLAVSNESMSIPQLGTATQTVTIHLENLALVRKLRQLPSDRMIIGPRAKGWTRFAWFPPGNSICPA